MKKFTINYSRRHKAAGFLSERADHGTLEVYAWTYAEAIIRASNALSAMYPEDERTSVDS
jgi:hypothetical protein